MKVLKHRGMRVLIILNIYTTVLETCLPSNASATLADDLPSEMSSVQLLNKCHDITVCHRDEKSAICSRKFDALRATLPPSARRLRLQRDESADEYQQQNREAVLLCEMIH
jgi:hypothetical protein